MRQKFFCHLMIVFDDSSAATAVFVGDVGEESNGNC